MDHFTEDILSNVVNVPSTSGNEAEMSIIKLITNNSKPDTYFICHLAVNTRESNEEPNGIMSGCETSPPPIMNQLTSNAELETCSYTQTQFTPIQQSATNAVSRHGATQNSCLATGTTNFYEYPEVGQIHTPSCCPDKPTASHSEIEDGQTNSPLTPRKLPFCNQSAANPKLKPSPLKSCYLDMESWDPLCHHINYDERNMVLPHDLRYLNESELLPMSYGDFTKCLVEDMCCSPSEMLTSATDDDGVVPSSPTLLPGDDARCYSSCGDTNDSQEYASESFSSRNENIYKSPSSKYDHPQYGTLNWGLSPTIIYKTPFPESSLQDGVDDGYMKCSISKGNVQLLTPPPPNYKKLLRRSRRRMERRQVKRRRIYFGNDENCQGLQEVPVNGSEKDSEISLDTDLVPDDPMWFEDDENIEMLADSKDKPFSISEQDIVECYENLSDVLPNSEEITPVIPTEAVEYMKSLEETLDGSISTISLAGSEDVLEILPQSSWNEMDEPSYEIQAILDGLRPLEEASVVCGEEPAPIHSPVEEERPKKRKRRYQKRTTGKQKTQRKEKKSSEMKTNQTQSDETRSNDSAQCCPDDNSNGQRSDCESVSLFDDNRRSNSSSRSNSRGSRCLTPIIPKPTPGVLVSPSVTGFIPLHTIGNPLILPKPSPRGACFSPPTPPVLSPLLDSLTSPRLVPGLKVIPTTTSFPVSSPRLLPTAVLPTPHFADTLQTNTMTQAGLPWFHTGQLVKVPARKSQVWTGTKERTVEKDKFVEKGLQKKVIPNGYMLYCKENRNHILNENPDLKSKPGDITKLLSENWNGLSEEERRPYVEEAMKLRCDENEWINQTP